jgi:hypothetical protein
MNGRQIRTWVWPRDYPYYVRVCDAEVPDELVEHAESLGWKPPRLTEGRRAGRPAGRRVAGPAPDRDGPA